jgi:hypothetical protein
VGLCSPLNLTYLRVVQQYSSTQSERQDSMSDNGWYKCKKAAMCSCKHLLFSMHADHITRLHQAETSYSAFG